MDKIEKLLNDLLRTDVHNLSVDGMVTIELLKRHVRIERKIRVDMMRKMIGCYASEKMSISKTAEMCNQYVSGEISEKEWFKLIEEFNS